MRISLLLALIMIAAAAFAQDTTAVLVHRDPRLDLLIKKNSEINAGIKKAAARTAHGYRLLVINTNKRDEAMAAKTRIYNNFPELKSYLTYQTPYFKLKAGNFRTRDEAVNYQKSLSAFFPKGVFIISDTIEVTPERED
jgi:hypothetical protein